MLEEHMAKWERLLEWAGQFKGFECRLELRSVEGAGCGLFTRKRVKTGSPLLVIPAAALLNPLTLAKSSLNTIPLHLFPEPSHGPATKRQRVSASSARLNTTQLLTLHLVLTRDPLGRHKSDWDVYLETLPKTFRPFHPLTWLVPETRVNGKVNGHGRQPNGNVMGGALAHVPSAANENVLRVFGRFEADLEVMRAVLRNEESYKEQDLVNVINVDDILWAWLTVNTRSVSVPLGLPSPTDLYNHSLVPILDFVNHSSFRDQCVSKPVLIPTSGSAPPRLKATNLNPNPHLVPGKIAFELMCSDRDLKAGEEVRFQYHAHGNTELWAEYGFVEVPADGKWDSLPWGQVDVSHVVGELWKGKEMLKAKEEALRACGCWDVNILVTHPKPWASHTLLMNLRVLHLRLDEISRLKSIAGATTTYVSAENEALAEKTLGTICSRLISEGKSGIAALEDDRDGRYWAVRKLWEEQIALAEAVLRNLTTSHEAE